MKSVHDGNDKLLTSSLSQPTMSPYDTSLHRQYRGSFGSGCHADDTPSSPAISSGSIGGATSTTDVTGCICTTCCWWLAREPDLHQPHSPSPTTQPRHHVTSTIRRTNETNQTLTKLIKFIIVIIRKLLSSPLSKCKVYGYCIYRRPCSVVKPRDINMADQSSSCANTPPPSPMPCYRKVAMEHLERSKTLKSIFLLRK